MTTPRRRHCFMTIPTQHLHIIMHAGMIRTTPHPQFITGRTQHYK